MTAPANKSITLAYYSDRMKDLKDLQRKSGMPTFERMIADAFSHYDIYSEYEAMKIYMVTCPGDDTTLLKAVEDHVSTAHMKVDETELLIEPSGWDSLQKIAGEEDVPAFLTRLFVIYEQIAEARFLKHRLGLLRQTEDGNPEVSWLHVVIDDDPQTPGIPAGKPPRNMMN